MNTQAFFNPISKRTFTAVFGILVFLLIVLNVAWWPADTNWKLFVLNVFFSAGIASWASFVLADLFYYDFYLPFKRWRSRKHVEVDTELLKVHAQLEAHAEVHALWGREFFVGRYAGKAPNGCHSIRLEDGRLISVSEVYLKVD